MKKKTSGLLMGICVTALAVSFGSAIVFANADGAEEEQTAPVLTMQEGASVRYMDPVGIRFVTDVATDKYEEIIEADSEAVFGTLIIPKKVLGDTVITAENYLTIDAENIVAKTWLSETETTKSFACALGGTIKEDGTYNDFPEAYYNVDLYAVSYCSYNSTETENTVIFAENPQCYSVGYIASVLQARGETDTLLSGITDSVLGETMAFASEEYTLYKGETLDTVLNAEGLKATYSTDNAAVATVDQNGVVTGVGAGTAQITAKIGNKSATVNVIVTVETPIALNGTYDFSLEGDESATDVVLEGNVTKIISGTVEITEGVSYAGGQLTLTKTALQSLLGGKAYAEGLAIEIYTSADKKYTATVNIATMFIDSAEDLTAITNANKDTKIVDAYYILAADIDASTAGVTVSGTAGTQTWTANNIVRFVSGDYSMSEGGFAGIFDGRGHVISNLNTFAYKYQGTGGLFGQLNSGSQVKNVAFTDVVINGRFGAMLVGESCGFYGLLENVAITVKAEDIVPYTGQNKDYTKIFWKLSGGEIKNCLFVGVEQIAFDSETTNVTNVMSVTTSENNAVKSNGGFNASGTKYNAQSNYASVNEMLSALATENKLQDWGDITYAKGKVSFNGTQVLLPVIEVSYECANREITRGNSVTFTTDGYATLSLKETVEGVSIENNILSVAATVTENAAITVVVTSTLNEEVTQEITFKVIRAYTTETIAKTIDFSLEGENSAAEVTIEGTVERIVAGSVEVTEGITYQSETLALTKAALTALLNGKNYAEGLTVNIYTSADKNYTATVNIATMFIDSADDLTAITNANTAATIDAYYIVTADIDASVAGITVNCTGNNQTYNNVVRFVNNDAVDSSVAGFAGIFDGRGHIISNITSYAYGYNALGGLFGQLLESSVVKNIAFTEVTAVGRYGTILVGESQDFSGVLENVVITVKDTSLSGTGAHTCAYIVANLAGGTFENCLFVGVGTISTVGSSGSAANVMSVATTRQDQGGFHWTGVETFTKQSVYASVEAMFEALATDNKLQDWGSITYMEGAIYFNGAKVLENAIA